MERDRFQNIRTRLHGIENLGPPRFDIYDSVRPRPAPWLFRYEMLRHFGEPIRSPISAPLSGLGTGTVDRLHASPALMERPPIAVIWRNGRWEFKCRFFGRATGCDKSFLSGVDEEAHVQRDHLSKNDLPASLDGWAFNPSDWWARGGISDRAGQRELIRSLAVSGGQAFTQRVLARAKVPGAQPYSRRIARHLA